MRSFSPFLFITVTIAKVVILFTDSVTSKTPSSIPLIEISKSIIVPLQNYKKDMIV